MTCSTVRFFFARGRLLTPDTEARNPIPAEDEEAGQTPTAPASPVKAPLSPAKAPGSPARVASEDSVPSPARTPVQATPAAEPELDLDEELELADEGADGVADDAEFDELLG